MPPTQQVAIRLTHEVIDRLDAYAADHALPGVPLSRSDTIRVLLELALAAQGYSAQQSAKPKRKPSKGKAPKPRRKAASKPSRAVAPTSRPKPQSSASGAPKPAHKPATGPDPISAAIERAEQEAMRGRG